MNKEFESDEELIAWWQSAGERDRDALACEKTMGWQWVTFMGGSYLVPPDAVELIVRPGLSWTRGRTGKPDYEAIQLSRMWVLPHPSTDLNLTAHAEKRTIKKVGEDAWFRALLVATKAPSALTVKSGFMLAVEAVLCVVRADASTRCLACLLALRQTAAEGEVSGG